MMMDEVTFCLQKHNITYATGLNKSLIEIFRKYHKIKVFSLSVRNVHVNIGTYKWRIFLLVIPMLVFVANSRKVRFSVSRQHK